MPELPEVETTRRGIEPHLLGVTIERVIVRNARLRWRVPKVLIKQLPGKRIESVTRRAKYILLKTDIGTVILHLGMSGRLLVIPSVTLPGKYDHVDFVLSSGKSLRLRDPRRFGSVHWTSDDPRQHKLLVELGPEPLDFKFDGAYLYRVTRRRKRAIRDLLLDGHVVAGIGNIYANEALFVAGLRPTRAAGRLTRSNCIRLVEGIRTTLHYALQAGGTSLRDYRNSLDEPGYFQLALKVYGRSGAACLACGSIIRTCRLGQRSAFYCPKCQP